MQIQEYVMVLIQNKKTRPQVAEDLDAFLGSALATDFSKW